ncbi:nucleotidyl transferase AbiEii/AbiGii toxin family protein [Candidatus Woesearchaeota archaeon]|nr:nucleotidyl transferase AbiEii/AbiGii toxin family protein [Candidatus Woesearchaeota archaeon]
MVISRTELEEYAKLKQLNLGQAEKDYFQHIVLFILYSHFGKELIFKGGTALSKAYGLGRFSEDLDFTLSHEEKIVEVLQEGLKKFYLEAEIEEKKFTSSFSHTLRIKGPLYNGVRHSLCKLELDFSLREKVILSPSIITLGRLLKELPAFEVVVMSKEEILAEKVRAIMTRTKARDVYDLWFLLQDNLPINLALINEKLKFYQLKYSLTVFQKHLNLKKEIWETELTSLIALVPSFNEVKKLILEKMKKVKS